MKPLKQALQKEIEKESLDASEVNELLSLQQQVINQGEGHAATNSRRYAIAASLAVLSMGIMFWAITTTNNPALTVNQRIAKEVVENHLKLKPLDIQTHSFAVIQQYFTQLAFLPQQSKRLPLEKTTEMLGGRYCSIQGVTAAQLRYNNANNEFSTLYQVAYNELEHGPQPNIEKGDKPRQLTMRGLSVELWQERGLLMVQVGAADSL